MRKIYSTGKLPHAFTALLVVCFLSTHTQKAFSQFPVYESYSVKDGLPSEIVYSALQDKKGFIWFATDAGVSRFDGVHFKNFSVKDGLADNNIIGLYNDAWERIWFIAFNGRLSFWKNDSIFNEATTPFLRLPSVNSEINNVVTRNNGNFWLSYNNGSVVEIGEKTAVITDLKSGNFISAFPHEVSDKEFWLFTSQSAYRYRNGIKDTLRLNNFPITNNYYFFMKSAKPRVSFFNNQNGICSLRGSEISLIIPAEKIPGFQQIISIRIDDDEGLWISTKSLNNYYWKKNAGGYEYSGSFFHGIHIGNVFKDREKNFWFCTLGSGALKISAGNLQTQVYHDSTARSDEITKVALDANGRIWYSNSQGILYRLQNDSVQKFLLLKFPFEIRSIQFSGKNCFIGSDAGLIKITGEEKSAPVQIHLSVSNTSTGLGNNLTAIHFDREGNLILAPARGIFKALHPYASIISIAPFSKIAPQRIYCLYSDFSNTLWFENFDHLYSYDGKESTGYPQFTESFKSKITGIGQTADSTLVISTYGSGIILIKNEKIIQQVNVRDGLASDLCNHFFIAGDTIYVATRNGFSVLSYSHQKVTGIKTITSGDGLPSNTINDICAAGNKIYLATAEGFCVVNKKIAQAKSDPPPLYITSVVLHDTAFVNPQSVSFPFNTPVTINWVALTYQQPARMIYEYRIGTDKDWTTSRNTSVDLSALAPDKYSFQVRAKKVNSAWTAPVTLTLTVVPAIWQSWWFRTMVFLFALTGGYFLLRLLAALRFRKQMEELKQQHALSDERNRIATDMHDDFGADLSNLLMMTRSTGRIKHLQEEERNQILKQEEFISGVIQKMDEIIWTLNPTRDSLGDLIQFIKKYVLEFRERSGLQGALSLPIEISDIAVASKFRRNVVLILKEALNNLLQHAHATSFEVAVTLFSNQFEMEVRDDGKGFFPSEKVIKGNGLLNMKKRMDELKGTFLFQPNERGGMTITIRAPLV